IFVQDCPDFLFNIIKDVVHACSRRSPERGSLSFPHYRRKTISSNCGEMIIFVRVVKNELFCEQVITLFRILLINVLLLVLTDKGKQKIIYMENYNCVIGFPFKTFPPIYNTISLRLTNSMIYNFLFVRSISPWNTNVRKSLPKKYYNDRLALIQWKFIHF